MKVNVFMDYRDCNPQKSSLEEVVCIIQTDTSIKDRTDKHRYYLSQKLTQAATNEKQSCMCFSVNVLFSAYNHYIDCKTADYKAFNTW